MESLFPLAPVLVSWRKKSAGRDWFGVLGFLCLFCFHSCGFLGGNTVKKTLGVQCVGRLRLHSLGARRFENPVVDRTMLCIVWSFVSAV